MFEIYRHHCERRHEVGVFGSQGARGNGGGLSTEMLDDKAEAGLPSRWRWGGQGTPPFCIILLVTRGPEAARRTRGREATVTARVSRHRWERSQKHRRPGKRREPAVSSAHGGLGTSSKRGAGAACPGLSGCPCRSLDAPQGFVDLNLSEKRAGIGLCRSTQRLHLLGRRAEAGSLLTSAHWISR